MLRLLIILTIASCALAAEFHVVHEWKYIDYVWNCREQKSRAIAGKRYNDTQIFTIDVQKAPDGRIFVTTPRFKPQGVPASLSIVSKEEGPGGPLLQPYPNWQWHESSDCKAITSVSRVALDDCNKLWVLDSGRIGDNLVCPAQLLVFDLGTDKLEKRLVIPYDVSQNSQNKSLGFLINLVVETEEYNCRRTWIYIADVEGGGLIVCDGSRFWRIENNVFNPQPDALEFSIAGVTFKVEYGLFGLAVTPAGSYRSRRLFFRPFASRKEYVFFTDDLHKSAAAKSNVSYTTLEYRLPSQASSQAFSHGGTLFFGLTAEIAIACWNSHTPMDDEHVVIVAQDDETLQLASGVKVTRSLSNKEQVWVTTNRLQKIWTGTQNFDEINYRILTAPVDDLVKGTKC